MERYLCQDQQTGESLGLFPTKRAAAVCLGDISETSLGLYRVRTGEDSSKGPVSLQQVYISVAS